MKPDKHLIAAAGIFVAAACLIVLTWVGTLKAIRAQQAENMNRVTATLNNQALTVAQQINRQILVLDQSLRILVTAWEANPAHFDLAAWRAQAVALNGLSRDMVLTDATGIIRQSSIADVVGQSAADLDYFRALAARAAAPDSLYIGPAAIDTIMRQWHMNVARSLHRPDGSFAGVIDTDYRITSITDVLNQADLGPDAFMALAGLQDGRLRGVVSSITIDPDASIADMAMFTAVRDADAGIWIGPSANDAVLRIHAFRHIQDRNLVVLIAMSWDEAMRPATVWRRQAELFAACITGLLIGLALVLIRGTSQARLREAVMRRDREVFAASAAQLEFARALAAAKAEQLEVTLAGMTDGVSMVDANLCLVEWNARFPEIAGVPAGILRVGLPMADVLRAQVRTGQFGWIQDPEAEVERRLARLRIAPFGVTQRPRPDGRIIELRRNRLPDGGFVTLYSDITDRKLAEEALRKAQAAAEAANVEKSRFVAIVSHEIRTPLNALLNTIRLLSDSQLAPAQRGLLTMAHQSGDVLYGLINDILDISQMEAGKLAIRPSLFELRPLLESCVELFAGQAAQRGMTMRVTIQPGTPAMLLTDPNRLRQVQLNLLSNAMKYARPGEVSLIAEPGRSRQEAVLLTVRDDGPPIPAEARDRLFRPFLRLDRPGGDDAVGTGLGLSICHHLSTLMGGKIGCDIWRSDNGHEGNAFWVALPKAALPEGALPEGAIQQGALPAGADRHWQDGGATVAGEPAGRPASFARQSVPRTRILLTEDIAANQLITATLLRREGHHVEVAASGPAAIAAMRTAPHDLVFMDIFMPGMSGQEATRIIRGLAEPARSTPIIALTANVGAADTATFKAAGMDGFLGKPMSLSELLDALRLHVWERRTRAAGSSRLRPARAAPSAQAMVLSAARIDELRTNLPPATFADLIEECLVDMDHRFPALRRALQAGAPGAVISHAHALVGMAAGYGMAALEARLRTVMNAARDGDLAVLGVSITAELENDLRNAANSLRELLRAEMV